MENDKMKIAILGAGAIGSLFGAYLSRKNDVIFIGRKEHVDKINSRGLIVEGIESFVVKGNGYIEYPGGADIIFLTVKSYDTRNAMEGIKGILNNELIVSLQNGIGNVEIISEYTENVIGAITTEASTFVSPGVIRYTGKGITKVGEIGKKNREKAVKVVSLINESGFKAEYTERIVDEIWIKAALNSCINPLTAILEIRNGDLLEENLLPIIDCLIDENGKVLRELNIDINLRDILFDVIRKTGENYSSMLQDIMHKKRTEIDQITGKIIEYASRHNIEMPCSKTLYFMMKEKERIVQLK
jgi:2-dehydropantoate 2-reductase